MARPATVNINSPTSSNTTTTKTPQRGRTDTPTRSSGSKSALNNSTTVSKEKEYDALEEAKNSPLVQRLTFFSEIGGLEKQIDILKDMIELPLRHPDAFKVFNMHPPKGILLYGPPGTGKTMLLRAIATEIDAKVFTISGSAIVSKYLGETESKLNAIFKAAHESQPSIIFIDEIDSIAPKRESEESTDDGRIVSSLLTLMDGADTAQGVVVIAATNRPNAIDEALRRPGRFDRELEIGIPDAAARFSILSKQLKDKPNKLNGSIIREIASRTHGFVGADLMSVVQEAGLQAIKRGLKSGTSLNKFSIDPADIENALKVIRPSAMREIFLEPPNVKWSDIGGNKEVKRRLKEAVEWPLRHPESFSRLGVVPPKGILLYGPSGCSKTLTAKALASESGLNFLAVKGSELLNKFVGEGERSLREIFRKARAASPSIIFFDEIDSLTQARGHSVSGDRMLTTMLNEMDGIESLHSVIIIAATNRPETIDAALLRPGRLDRLIYVGLPDYNDRVEILRIKLANMRVSDDVNAEALAARTEGFSGAEITALCQNAGLEAMHESLEASQIELIHFELVFKGFVKKTSREMLDLYEQFASVAI